MSLWPAKEKILYETESLDTTIQVVEKGSRRELRFGNKVVQSAKSLSMHDHLLLAYTRFMMLGLLLNPQPRHVLHVGLGAGNIPRFLFEHFPLVQQDVVELHPPMTEIAHQYFGLPRHDSIRVHTSDALQWVAHHQDQQYDLIFLDAFEAQGMPEHLTTRTFLSLLHDRLKEGGWVVGNVWTGSRSLSRQLRFWDTVFEAIFLAPVPTMGNAIIFGGKADENAVDKIKLKQIARNFQKSMPLQLVEMLRHLEHLDRTRMLSSHYDEPHH